MAYNVPDTPTDGQVIVVSGRSWVYSTATSSWQSASTLAGGTGLDQVLLFSGM